MAVDKVFKEQEEMGVIKKIPNLNQFMSDNPQCSFLPHMCVIRMSSQSTKYRVVYLSNLCEKNPQFSMTVSHNQALYPGPNMNQKLSTALHLLRFDKYIFTFDIKKAFLNIALRDVDANRLLFLWYQNVEKNNLDLVAYKSVRVPFGLPPSPNCLLSCLYRILIIDAEDDDTQIKQLKQLLYALIYVDNGSFTTNDPKVLKWAFEMVPKVFEPYQFYLQQYVTNDAVLQKHIDETGE